MILEGKHAELGTGIFISDIQEGSPAEQVNVMNVFVKIRSCYLLFVGAFLYKKNNKNDSTTSFQLCKYLPYTKTTTAYRPIENITQIILRKFSYQTSCLYFLCRQV